MKCCDLDSSETVVKFSKCPRCGCNSIERLKTYGHCPNCNYNTVEGLYLGDNEETISKRRKNLRKIGMIKPLKKLDVSKIVNVQNSLKGGC